MTHQKGIRSLPYGYNAALIARLTGDPATVTTIEWDAAVATQAEQVLHALVGKVRVQAGDGHAGFASQAPYDRIIATASAGYIPRAWYEQLAPGGRLVMDLQGKQVESGFLVVEKSPDGRPAWGSFWQPPLRFMPMQRPESLEGATQSLFQLPCSEEITLAPESPLPELFRDSAFRWFLQWFYRTLTVTQPFCLPKRKTQAIVLKDVSHETILQLARRDEGGWQGKQRGTYPLWKQVGQASQQFLREQRPEQECYDVVLESQTAQLRLTRNRENPPIILCDLYHD